MPQDKLLAGTRRGGAVTKSPACAVGGSPARLAVPISAQCLPSAESYPVIVSPERVSRSQRGDAAETVPGRPAVSRVKSYCIRTPWAGVAMTAA